MSAFCKIGVSLSPHLLCDCPDNEGDRRLYDKFSYVKNLLYNLKEAGVTHIELRNLEPFEKDYVAKTSIERIREFGFGITIHSKLSKEITPYDFCSYYYQYINDTAFTFHAFDDGKVLSQNRAFVSKMLREYADFSNVNNMKFTFALENCRVKDKNTVNGLCSHTLSCVSLASRKNAGICFDFGHRISNVRNGFVKEGTVPDKAFLKRVVHTHIHDLLPNFSTHGPLLSNKGEVENLVTVLKESGYDGIYNLELEPNRYYEIYDPADALFQSIETLRQILK